MTGKSHLAITRDAATLSEFRAFLAECDRIGLGDATVVHVRTRFSWSPHGPLAKTVTAVSGETTQAAR